MIALLLLLLLLILLFGGLGIFVAKVFFVALAVVLVVGLLTGGMGIPALVTLRDMTDDAGARPKAGPCR